MLRSLRLRLTLLYFLIGFLLVALLGSTTYGVLFFYFQNASDQALKIKMASVFDTLGIKKPIQLSSAQPRSYSSDRESVEGHFERDLEIDDLSTNEAAVEYEGELASIFILPTDSEGQLLFNPNPFTPPMTPNHDAIDQARQAGNDLRTINIIDGTSVRLLTYSILGEYGIDFIQLGIPIEDQLRILNQFLRSLIVIGSTSVVILGFGSWWQAGRMLATAEKAWENQQLFIANASHELRAPLTLIRAASDAALRKNKGQPDIERLLGDIIQESDYMSHLVEDLLLLTRLDVGQLKMNIERIDLKEFSRILNQHFQPLMIDRGVDFQVKAEKLWIQGDRTRLHQVLLIILDNALRHSRSGGIINLEITASGRNVLITVTDSGEGIPPEFLDHVFDRFFQVKSDRRENSSGTGLGLSIAKSIIEAHGGTISVQSEVGKCTAVRILLPSG